MTHSVDTLIQTMVNEINYDELNHHLQLLTGGKRLRAKLVLKIAGESEASIKLGAIVELIHAASLLHDDVIDEAVLRRGKETVNATEGSKTAIMLGDILYSKAYHALCRYDDAIAEAISESVMLLSVGEMMDVKLAESFNSDEAAYMQMLYNKTATLIEAACYSAALLSNKPDAKAYAQYGKNLGLAFQVIDDILDITSDDSTLGKPALNDFYEGKCTLPYIFLYNALDAKGKKKLVSLFKTSMNKDQSEWVKEQMQTFGCIEKAREKARALSLEAKNAIKDDAPLCAIVDAMLEREF